MILRGSCVMFTASKKVTWENDEYEFAAYSGDYYVEEPFEVTKARLSKGLETIGFRCLKISIKWFDKYGGGKSSIDFECECDDNMMVEREMYIHGMKTEEWDDESRTSFEIFFPNI